MQMYLKVLNAFILLCRLNNNANISETIRMLQIHGKSVFSDFSGI